MIPQIKNYIETNWDKFFSEKPKSLQLLLLSNPQGKKITHGKCTVLVFKNHEKTPVLVSKFLRTNNALEEKITNEHDLLQSLREWGQAPISYDLAVINGKTVSFEQYKVGISLKASLQKKVNKLSLTHVNEVIEHMANDFIETASTLHTFRELKIDSRSENNSYADKAIVNKNSLYELLELSDKQKILLNKIIDAYDEKQSNSRLVHFDLTPSNILEHNGLLNFIDLEFSQISKHSFTDPLRFIFYYFHLIYELGILPYESYEASFYYFFQENSKSKQIVRDFYASTIGNYSEEAFYSYMSMFLLFNLQLQLDETDFINDVFIKQISDLLGLSLKLANGDKIDMEYYRENDSKKLFSTMSLDDLINELKKSQELLADYQAVIIKKDEGLETNSKYIAHCHEVIEQKDKELTSNIQYINHCHSTISNKDETILKLELELQSSRELISAQQDQITILQEKLNQTFLKKIVRKIRKR